MPHERIEIRLDGRVRPCALVEGRVSVPAGILPADVQLGLFRGADLCAGVPEPIAEGSPAEDGTFRLRTDFEGPVTVAAFLEGLRPAEGSAYARIGSRSDMGRLELDASGATIFGLVNPPPGITPPNLQISAQEVSPAPAADVPTLFKGLTRRAGRFVSTSRTVVPNEDGSFAFEALEAGTWDLHVSGGWGFTLLTQPARVRVRAPSTGAVLGQDLCRVQVEVRRAGEPWPGARVLVVGPADSLELETNEEGGSTLLVWGGADYELAVSAEGTLTERRTLPAGRAADSLERFDLVDSVETASLIVLAPPDHPLASAWIGASIRRAADSAGTFRQGQLAGGRLEWLGLAPGLTRVEIEPWSPSGLPAGMFGPILRPESFEVELVAGQAATIQLALPEAGRLRIEFTGFGAGESEAWGRLEVLDPAGEPVGRAVLVNRGSVFTR
jgi:hypothetical protein